MLKRNDYPPYPDTFLTQYNEPPVNSKYRRYPDMLSIYNKFSSISGLPKNRFFLANGAENAIKNVLLALSPKSLFYAYPSWGMIDVICSALKIQVRKQSFFLKNEDIIEPENYSGAEVYYSCYGRNNLFSYKNNFISNHIGSKYTLIDASYFSLEEIQEIYNKYKTLNNVIIVGSFDKTFGAGLRLGFAIFPEELNNKMQLQRENFINYEASQFLLKDIYTKKKESFYKKVNLSKLYKHLGNPYSKCLNFMTYKGKIPSNKKIFTYFQIGDTWFTRIGRPKNRKELKELYKALKIPHNFLQNFLRKVYLWKSKLNFRGKRIIIQK